MFKKLILAAGICLAVASGAGAQTNPSVAVIAQTLRSGDDSATLWLKFQPAKDKLLTESDATLDDIANVMNSNPTWKFGLICYTDNQGSVVGNNILSRNRAIAVIAALGKRRVDRNRIVAIGAGGRHPVADNSTPAGRELNNRIVLVRNITDEEY